MRVGPISLALVMALCIGLGIAAGRFFPRLHVPPPAATPPMNQAAVLRQVRTMSEWVTVKYVMEKLVAVEDIRWYGENRLVLAAHGIIKAGVDLKQIAPSQLRIREKEVILSLPSPQITDLYLDETKTRIMERSTGLLRQFDKDLEQRARQRALEELRTAALKEEILVEARVRAQEQLNYFFRVMGHENVQITFE